MHLPLFVKGNTLLPVGSNAETPEYDYTKDLTLRYYLPVANKEVQIEIPDLTGKTVLTASAVYDGKSVTVTLDKCNNPVNLEIIKDSGEVIKKTLTDAKTSVEL